MLQNQAQISPLTKTKVKTTFLHNKIKSKWTKNL